MPETRVERMRECLQRALAPQVLRIDDDSAAHAGHEGAKGGGGHYRLYLVSDRFAGLNRIARHRLVYDALRDFIPRDIHALAMTLLTPAEAAGAGSTSRKK